MASSAKVVMYAGPTLARASAIAPRLPLGDIIVLPPVKRGDVTRLVQQRPPGVLAIVDGYFHLQNLSVGHLEIRLALKRGWQVWGLSSMGAIRAAEMHHMGVHGWGAVFTRYRDDGDFRDDEVALLHEPNPPYREGTEPLVHMRAGLDDLVARGVLGADEARGIVDELMEMWFGERSLVLLRDLVLKRQPEKAELVHTWLQGFDRFRTKAHDLVTFLEARPWLTQETQKGAP
jgi:hypothetical protein